MSNDTVVSLGAPARVWDPLTELLRAGARRLTAPLRGHVPESIFWIGVHGPVPLGRTPRRRFAVLDRPNLHR